jgi:hypothetical protein
MSPADLIPVDPLRCQAEQIVYRPFVMGGSTRQTERCANAPTWIAREKKAGDDGRHGEMSLCEPCLKIFEKKMPKGVASFRRIKAQPKPALKKRKA